MEKKQILANLIEAVTKENREQIREITREALRSQIDPIVVIEQGLSKGMAIIGEQFGRGDVYLPELLFAARNFNAAMEILKPEIESKGKEVAKLGKILLGTAKGDVHDIGKNIVSTVLKVSGFEVFDLGIDIPSLTFVDQAEKLKVDIIALSSLMTTTMSAQKEVIEILNDLKVRDRYLVMVGGGPVTLEWAKEIGADGYGRTAIDASETAKQLLLDARKIH